MVLTKVDNSGGTVGLGIRVSILICCASHVLVAGTSPLIFSSRNSSVVTDYI